MTIGEFLEDCHECLAESLRTAGWYDGEQVGLLYVRGDLPRSRAEERMRELHESLPPRVEPPADGPLGDLGELSGAVQVRSDGLVVQFPITPRFGLVMTVDPAGISDLEALFAARPGDLEEAGLALRGGRSGGEAKRCPHCGSTNYEVRSNRPGRPRGQDRGKFRCRYCDEEFDTPIIADSRLAVLEDE